MTMKRKQITSILMSMILAVSAFCVPSAQLPVYAAEEGSAPAAENDGEEAAPAAEAAGEEAEDVVLPAGDEEASDDILPSVGEESSAAENDAGDDGDLAAVGTYADEQDLQPAPESSEEQQTAESAGEEEPEDDNAQKAAIKGVKPAATERQEVIPEDYDDTSCDDLFAGYANRSFGIQDGQSGQPQSGRKKAPRSAASGLTGINRAIYNKIAGYLPEIAAGERASTAFEINVDELGLEKTSWTAEELGLSSLFVLDENGDPVLDEFGYASVSGEALQAFEAELAYSLPVIVAALLADHPYELYWYEKTEKTGSEDYGVTIEHNSETGEYRLSIVDSFTITFPVAGEYSAGEYMVDTAIGQAVQTSVENANEIVEQYSGEEDYDKLIGYKDEICSLVSYYDAAAAGEVSYGNPWQLIWVFDEDPGTNVVCEGYAKAFKYLCDRTDFDGDISCITVTGRLNDGTVEGAHMWNIVKMEDGKNYLADVTNSDSGTSGESGELFLVPYTSGSVEDGYTFIGSGDVEISYVYSDETFSIFNEEELTLSEDAYGYTRLEITEDPESVAAGAGETVSLHVEANLSDVAYQWQWSADEVIWKDCTSAGCNTDTFSFNMKASISGRQYRCKVTRGDEIQISNTALISYVPVKIVKNPANIEVKAGELAEFLVEAIGNSLKYQWQWSADGETWKNCSSAGCNTDTFSFKMKASVSGRQYRCIVTSGGQTSISEAGTVTLTRDAEITGQPSDVEAEAGDTVSFTVEVRGDNPVYQWQWSADGTAWRNCSSAGFNTASFSFRMKESVSGRLYRCKVTCGGKTLFSDAARITLLETPLEISCQPEDVSAAAGESVSLHVEANADNVTFRWQWSGDGTTWKNCTSTGYNTDTFSFKMKESLDGRLYRCKLSRGSESIVSDSALISFIVTRGSCGDRAVWSFDPASGTFTISGTGDMWDYRADRPWLDLKDKIKKVIVEEGITHIGARSFDDFTNLVNVELPDSLNSIGNRAFYHAGITSVAFSSNLTVIGESAFGCCSYLETCYFDGAMTQWQAIEVGEDNNSLLKSAGIICNDGEIDPSITWDITDGVFTLYGEGETDHYYWYGDDGVTAPWSDRRGEIRKVVISEGITGIYGPMFANCYDLTEVSLPGTLKTLGNTVFDGCMGLESITIPEGVESIGASAFWNCFGLRSITIPDTVTGIGHWAFGCCNELSDIYFSGSAGQWKTIEGLQSALVPEDIHMHFGADGQFDGDWGYELAGGECVINAYRGNDTEVIVPGTIEGCPVTEVNISPLNSDGSRNEAVFEIAQIQLPDSVVKLGDGAFRNWSALRTISGLGSVQYVGEYCFSGSGAESLEFSAALSWAGLYAFDANDLRSITIPDTLRWEGVTGGFSGTSPFLNHENLETIHLIETGDTPVLTMAGPGLYTADMVNLVCYPCKNPLRSYSIPEGVFTIYPMAFDIRDTDSTDGLYELYIPSSVSVTIDSIFYTGIFIEKPDGTTENVILPRLIVEDGSWTHQQLLQSSKTYYWRLAGS